MKVRCDESNIPIRGDLTFSEYKARLQYGNLAWELPWHELEKDCAAWGIPLTKFNLRRETTENRGVLLWLVFAKWNGVPVERLDSSGSVTNVCQQYTKMEAMPVKELRQLCRDWKIPEHDVLSRDDYLNRLQRKLLYYELSLHELQKECKELGITLNQTSTQGREQEKRESVLDQLMFSICHAGFKAMEVPLERLDSWKSAWQLHKETIRINASSLSEVTSRYEAMHLSSQGLTRAQIVERLKLVSLWQAMSLNELHKECREQKLSSSGGREALASSLASALWKPRHSGYSPEPQSFFNSTSSSGSSSRPTFGTPNGGARPNIGPAAKSAGPPPNGGARPNIRPPQPPQQIGAPAKIVAHFKTLGLDASARVEDVKRAYLLNFMSSLTIRLQSKIVDFGGLPRPNKNMPTPCLMF